MTFNAQTGEYDEDENGAPRLILLGVEMPNNLGTTGAMFRVTQADLPSGNSGQYSWVQLITTEKSLFYAGPGGPAAATGKLMVERVYGSSPALDGFYPYPHTETLGTSDDMAHDNPAVDLTQTPNLGELARIFAAKMYLMWTPDELANCTGDACAIPIPLGYVDWGFQGDTINTLDASVPLARNTTTWMLYCTSETPAAPSFQTTTIHPQWARKSSDVTFTITDIF
jgi:hypothetical protein